MPSDHPHQLDVTSTGPLRIGVIAPPWVPVPPPAYGGTELVIDGLCTGLAAAGHEVTLFTTADSTCPVPKRWLFEHSDPDRIGNAVIELRHAAAAYDELVGLDVIHDHTLAGLFISEHYLYQPVVTTIHGPFDEDLADLYHRVDRRIPIVAISYDQASRAPERLSIADVIHHGIDTANYPFGAVAEGAHLLFLGRMSPAKGVETAITAARRSALPLKIAAKMREPLEFRYFESCIEPLLDEDVEYVGEVGFDDKVRLLSTARALINPIEWPEPFGLVMIEALACGTPVVGYGSGAAPEIVDHGVTGFLTSDVDGLVDGLQSIDSIDRLRCREVVERRFSIERMADQYVDVYRLAIDHGSTDEGLPTWTMMAG